MSDKDKKTQKGGITNQEYSFKHCVPLESVIKDNPQSEKLESKILIDVEPNQEQKDILKACHDLNILQFSDNEMHINEDVRKIEYLFWLNEKLKTLGFKYTEENKYSDESHKIITKNFISTNKKNIGAFDIQNYTVDNFFLYFVIILMNKGYISKNYIYLKDIDNNLFKIIEKNLNTNNISLAKLSITKESFLVRIKTISDCDNLKMKLEDYIKKVPCFYDKFYQITPQASITKKLVFDSAHYITDHDGKCKNLHGGRYDIEIKIKDRIDPMTGFVIDYSLIKNVTKSLVINKFDHKTLNLTCPELSWRSSTEFLAIVIWEILIEYLPNLDSIKIYETETSFCEFQGSSLDDYLKSGPSEIVGHYKNLNREMIKEKVFAGK